MAREDPPSALGRGQALGRYVIVDQVGRGAMGEVYRAHDTALDRMVAIKVLTCTLDDAPLRESITVREGQMLAKVAHPNVVAVYDVGVSDGWPFIALELVEGMPLSAWADKHEPSPVDLERMLHRLAAGLQAIHDAGLIHRDIKPGNILVEDDGHPRLADLGVAKLLDDMSRDPEINAVTIVGTHGFMAPEVADGTAATPASDIYSLCSAIDRVMPDAKLDATARRLRELVERGMSSDPDARPTAQEIHAVTRPRPKSQRQAVVGVLGVLVGAGGIYAWLEQPHPRCKPASRSIDEVWNDVKRGEVRDAVLSTEHPIAEDVAQRVGQGLDDYAALWEEQYGRVCASASSVSEDVSVERAFRCLGRRRIELGALADALGSIEGGGVLLAMQAVAGLDDPKECLEAGVEHDVDPETAGAALTRLAASSSIAKLGRYEESRARADEIINGEEPLTTALRGEAYVRRAQAELALGRSDAALVSFREAYYAGLEGEDARLLLWGARGLMSTHVTREEGDEARHWLRAAKILAQRLDEPTWDLAHREGLLAYVDGDLDAAERLLKQAIEQENGRAGSQQHVMRNDLATVLLRKRDLQAALEQLRLGHASCVKSYGDNHPHTAGLLGSMGMVYRELGRLGDAAEALVAAQAQLEASVGTAHPLTAVAAGNLGVVYGQMGRFDDAMASYERAAAILREAGGSVTADLVFAELAIAETLSDSGRAPQALEHLADLSRDSADVFASDPRLRSHLEHELANAQLANEDALAAVGHATSAVELATKVWGLEHPETFKTMAQRAEVLVALARYDEAAAILDSLLQAFDGAPELGLDIAWAYFVRARALEGTGSTRRALESAKKADAAFGEGDPVRREAIRAWLSERQP